MVKKELNVPIRPVEKMDWIRFAMNLEDGLDDDPFYRTALDTLKQASNINAEIEKCYVAEFDGNILGFIYGYALPSRLLIPEFIYVKPNYRKNGIAKNLLFMLEKESKCNLSMIFYNKTLREHYCNLGYNIGDNLEVAIKELKGDNPDGQNEI